MQCPYGSFHSVIICSQSLLPVPAVPIQALRVNICTEATGTGSHCRLQHWPTGSSSCLPQSCTITVAATIIIARLASVPWAAPGMHRTWSGQLFSMCIAHCLPCLEAWPHSHVCCLDYLLCAHMCSFTSSDFLTKHKFNDKIITDSKMVTAEHNQDPGSF